MKTGLIVNIKDGKAVIIQPGGRFITADAKPEWEVGDLVPVPRRPMAYLRPLMSVACAALISLLSIGGYRAYTTPTLLVSLDVNPSIELETNRFNRIISFSSYNQEGEELLLQSQIRNQSLQKAVESLFENGLERYLEDSPYVTFSVQSKSDALEQEALRQLQAVMEALPSIRQDGKIAVDYYTADDEQVQSAHGYHITAGKYLTLLQLQQIEPQTQVEEYSRCGIDEIKEQIARCHSQTQNAAGYGQTPQEGPSVVPSLSANAPTAEEPESAPAPIRGCGRHHSH